MLGKVIVHLEITVEFTSKIHPEIVKINALIIEQKL